jgi:hypothetical protein
VGRSLTSQPDEYVRRVAGSHLTIYDPVDPTDPSLWIPTEILEFLLARELSGLSLRGFPLRTRSKFVKEKVCAGLGYPVPPRFLRVRPRFPGQRLDVYVQKSNNMQVWNEELAPTRRYAIVRVSDGDVIDTVRVLTGEALSEYDTTGTLTSKYQARVLRREPGYALLAERDTDNLLPLARADASANLRECDPTDFPKPGTLLPIAVIGDRLRRLLGLRFRDAGTDQERLRGSSLHARACEALGYNTYRDHGQFPDIRHQLVEVKLQTSPTIDLGLVRPDDDSALEIPVFEGRRLRHQDVRYAVFGAAIREGYVLVDRLDVVPGALFFTHFPRFGGKVVNRKLQIRLPDSLFG